MAETKKKELMNVLLLLKMQGLKAKAEARAEAWEFRKPWEIQEAEAAAEAEVTWEIQEADAAAEAEATWEIRGADAGA